MGKPLVAAALHMEEAVYTAEREAIGLERSMSGPLTLSLPEAAAQHLLMDELGHFSAAFPGIELTLHTSNTFANLDRRDADLVVRIANDPPDHLVGRRLFKYARCHYGAPAYLTGEDPARMRWLGWPDDSGRPGWVRDSPYPDVPVGLRIEDPLVRHAAALAGHGLVFVACFLADPDQRLVRVPGSTPAPDRDIWVLTHPDLKGYAEGIDPDALPCGGHRCKTRLDRGPQTFGMKACCSGTVFVCAMSGLPAQIRLIHVCSSDRRQSWERNSLRAPSPISC